MLALVVVSFKYGGLPCQVFGTAPTLILSIVLSFANGLALLAAIDVLTLSETRTRLKLEAANLAVKDHALAAALLGAVCPLLHMRWRLFYNLAACSAFSLHFVRPTFGGAGPRAVAL